MKLLFAKRKPRKCPVCGKAPVASILWGMPGMDAELEEKIAKGSVTLGGCCVGLPSPMWRCEACKADIYREGDRFMIETMTRSKQNN